MAVSRPVDLRAVARILDVTLDELRSLNPALRGLSTPANYPDFQLKIPAGDLQPEVERKIAELPTVKFKPPPEYEGRYRVREGDTLYTIAARRNVTVTQLERANKGISPKALRVGRWINVPPSTSRVSARIRPSRLAAPRISTAASSSSRKPDTTNVQAKGTGKGASSVRAKPPAAKPKPQSPKKPTAGEIAAR